MGGAGTQGTVLSVFRPLLKQKAPSPQRETGLPTSKFANASVLIGVLKLVQQDPPSSPPPPHPTVCLHFMAPRIILCKSTRFIEVCGPSLVSFFHRLEPLRHKILSDDVLDSVGVLFLVGHPPALADSRFGRRSGPPVPQSASWTFQSSSDLPQSRQNAPRLHKCRRESRSAPTAARL